MKDPIELYVKAGDDPDVRTARHDADNKLCAVQMCQALLNRANTPEKRERYTQLLIKNLSECSNAFAHYLRVKNYTFMGLMLAEGYNFVVDNKDEDDMRNVIPFELMQTKQKEIDLHVRQDDGKNKESGRATITRIECGTSSETS